MIIECRNCTTRFEIDDKVIAEIEDPRFHCSRCGHYFGLEETENQTSYKPVTPTTAIADIDIATAFDSKQLPLIEEDPFPDLGLPLFDEQPLGSLEETDYTTAFTASWPDSENEQSELSVSTGSTQQHTQLQEREEVRVEKNILAKRWDDADDNEHWGDSAKPELTEFNTADFHIRDASSEAIEPRSLDISFRRSFSDLEERDKVFSDNSSIIDFPIAPDLPSRAHALPPISKKTNLLIPVFVLCSVPIMLLFGFFALSAQVHSLSNVQLFFAQSVLSTSPQVPSKGLQLIDLQSVASTLHNGAEVFEITGKVYNASIETFSNLSIRAQIFNHENRAIGEIIAPINNALLNASILSLDAASILELQSKENLDTKNFRPNETALFRVIVPAPTDGATWFSASLHSARRMSEERLLTR